MLLPARVQAFAERHALWTPSTRVVAAVSGGADSVGLLRILDVLAREGHLVLAGLAHLHHHIRGREADEDAVYCEDLARQIGIPTDIGHDDVPARARREGQSLELAARHARLAFFDGAAERLAADVIALAHTRRDQAETVLLRLVRGAGPRGMAAMAPRNGIRVRPLLDVSHQDLREFLAARGQTWREDRTNLDVAIPRNLLRHAVMPQLARLNPRAEDALVRAARIHAADASLLEQLARDAAMGVVQRSGDEVRLDVRALEQLPEAISRRVVRGALESLDPLRTHGWEEVDAVVHACRHGRARDVPGLRMERIAGFAVLTSRRTRRTEPAPASIGEVSLTVPGTARDPAGRWVIEARGPLPPVEAETPAPTCAVLDAEALGRHLTIRGWRPGDRIAALGLRGRKKLQDVFVDRKVPRDERRLVPIVTDAEDRIAWVAGHLVGEPFRVTPHSRAVVILTLRR